MDHCAFGIGSYFGLSKSTSNLYLAINCSVLSLSSTTTLADSLSFDFLDISILIGSHRVSYISFLKCLLDLLLKCLVGYVAFCQLSLLREPIYQVSVRKVLILSLPSFIGLITKYNLDLTMRFLYETTSTDFHRLDM